MFTGEAKKKYQREYMREYMRKRRAAVKTDVKTQPDLLRPDVKTSDRLSRENAHSKRWSDYG